MKVHGRHHHKCENPWDEAPPWAVELGYIVGLLLANTEKIMTDTDDLKQAIADLTTQLTANTAEIEDLLTKITTPGVSSADVQSAVASIRALIKSNQDEIDKSNAAFPG